MEVLEAATSLLKLHCDISILHVLKRNQVGGERAYVFGVVDSRSCSCEKIE